MATGKTCYVIIRKSFYYPVTQFFSTACVSYEFPDFSAKHYLSSFKGWKKSFSTILLPILCKKIVQWSNYKNVLPEDFCSFFKVRRIAIIFLSINDIDFLTNHWKKLYDFIALCNLLAIKSWALKCCVTSGVTFRSVNLEKSV